MLDLSLFLGVLACIVSITTTVVFIVTGTLLSFAGGVAIGLYAAAWIAWSYEYLEL